MVTTAAGQRNTLALVSLGAKVLSVVLLTFVAVIALVLAAVATISGALAARRRPGGLPLHFLGILLGLVAIVWFVIEVA
jgi:hypothetical protein